MQRVFKAAHWSGLYGKILHCRYYQLSHGCQGDTEKYLTRGNLYHPRHTCVTRDVVEGNTGVSRVIQVFEGQIISPYHPGNHVITTLSHRRNYKLLENFMETGMKPDLRYVEPFVQIGKKAFVS